MIPLGLIVPQQWYRPSDRITDYWADDTPGLIVPQQWYRPSDRITDYWADDTPGLIVPQQWYRPSDSNKNVDVKCSAHDAFLEYYSSGTLKVEKFESQII